MGICACDITALEIYRSSGRLLPDVLSAPRTSKLETCTIPTLAVLRDTLPRLGAKTEPYHLAVSGSSPSRGKKGTIRRVISLALPSRSFIKLKNDVLITCPELTFCMLASLKEIDVIQLALLGFELCGTYVLDTFEESWKGFTNTEAPITSKQKIARMLSAMGQYPGARKARQALDLVVDGSNSPMETVQAALLGFPRSLGGLGFGPCSLNHKITTGIGDRYIDLALPNYKVGFEYKGRDFHTPEQTSRDDRRQNKIAGSGYTIFNVWYEDLAKKQLFDELTQDAAKAMGTRLRIRSSRFAQAQRILRMKVLPALKDWTQQ